MMYSFSVHSGDVFSWGWNVDGVLGYESKSGSALPQKVTIPSREMQEEHNNSMQNPTLVKALACGAKHSAILLENGNVYTWGSNAFGQLGCCLHSRATPTVYSSSLPVCISSNLNNIPYDEEDTDGSLPLLLRAVALTCGRWSTAIQYQC